MRPLVAALVISGTALIAGMFATFLINSTSGPVDLSPRASEQGWFGFGRPLPAPAHPYTLHRSH